MSDSGLLFLVLNSFDTTLRRGFSGMLFSMSYEVDVSSRLGVGFITTDVDTASCIGFVHLKMQYTTVVPRLVAMSDLVVKDLEHHLHSLCVHLQDSFKNTHYNRIT